MSTLNYTIIDEWQEISAHVNLETTVQVTSGNTVEMAFSSVEPTAEINTHLLYVGKLYEFPASSLSMWIRSDITTSKISITDFVTPADGGGLSNAQLRASPINMMQMEVDTTGVYFFPINSCSVVETYNGDGTLSTTTLTDPLTANQFEKTYSYTNGTYVGETGWVKQ